MLRILSVLCLMQFASSQVLAQNQLAGEALYNDYCQVCHGIYANGEGPMSPIMIVQPTDLTLLSSSNNGIFPLERVIMRIDGRDPLVSHGSNMPIYGFLFDEYAGKPTTMHTDAGQPIMTSQPITELVEWLISIQREP